jgi:hypothetical protein
VLILDYCFSVAHYGNNVVDWITFLSVHEARTLTKFLPLKFAERWITECVLATFFSARLV